MQEIWTSKQFQYSLFQSYIAGIVVLLAAGAAFFAGENDWRMAVSAVLGGLIPILMRMKEGVGDANKSIEGEHIPSDVIVK